MKQDIHIPDNIAKWIKEHDGVNLSINFNSASADHGYAHMIWHNVVISMIDRHCNRCGYDILFNPDDSESRCLRHTYSPWKYEDVFVWSEFQNPLSLEESFTIWLENQTDKAFQPVKRMTFGQLGFR